MSAIGFLCSLDGESRVKEQAAYEDDVAVDEREAHGEAHLPTRGRRKVIGS